MGYHIVMGVLSQLTWVYITATSVVKSAPQVGLVNGAFSPYSPFEMDFSAGYAKSEIYSPMVSARIFSQVQYLYPTTTMWGPQIANPIPMLSDYFSV